MTDPSVSSRAPRLGEIGLDNFAPYLMNRIMGRYNADLRQQTTAMGLTTPKMRALAVLSVVDGLLIRELAVYAVVEMSTLSRALDQLDALGLVQRVPDPTDNRATRISITPAGRDSFETHWPTMAQAYEQMFENISEDERHVFVGTLKKIPGNIRLHDF